MVVFKSSSEGTVLIRIKHRLSSFDAMLWSDVEIAGVPVGLKRYLLALIPMVLVFQCWFDWIANPNAAFAAFATYKTMVDIVCTVVVVLTVISVLSLAIFGRPRVAY